MTYDLPLPVGELCLFARALAVDQVSSFLSVSLSIVLAPPSSLVLVAVVYGI
jgi:hypothetical protein